MSDDAIVVGAGPNGLAAAVVFARAGLAVRVLERADTIGGGARSAELTMPGFMHDVGSAVHPMAAVSGFFRRFGLAERIDMIAPEISYAHPLDGGRAGIAFRDLERTVETLGRDGPSYRALLSDLVARDAEVARFTLSPMLRVPPTPVAAGLFALAALDQGSPWWNERWRGDVAPAMLAGVMAHAIRPLPSLSGAAAGLALAVHAHAQGWPVPRGGSRSIVDALADDIREHGGVIETGVEVTSLAQVADARAAVFDVSARSMARIGGRRFPASYSRALRRFRYGNGASKVDFALSEPVPWSNADVRRSPTVHLGGTRAQIAAASRAVHRGRHPSEPYVLVVQPGVIDPSRAPEGKAVLWAYTHVPHDSDIDQTAVVIAQIERYAPGFTDTILASSSHTAKDLENDDPNLVGGDLASGTPSMRQLIARPVLDVEPWRTPVEGVYLGSSSTVPGPSVHGLGGAYAARSALRHEFGIHALPHLGPSPQQRARRDARG